MLLNRNHKILFLSIFILALTIGLYGQDGIMQEKTFGTYIVPEGWVEAEPWRRGEKYFYVAQNSVPGGRTTTNISVELGSNPYSQEDHEVFRYAILRQLMMQVRDAEVSGSGTFTDQGYPLYIFTIEDEKETPRVKTVQFYIIGEKKHILVHLTDFYNKNAVDDPQEIALSIVNSFAW